MTNWIYAALMLVPFGLLLPIGQAIPRSHVWLASHRVAACDFAHSPASLTNHAVAGSTEFSYKPCGFNSCSACCLVSDWSCDLDQCNFIRAVYGCLRGH